MYIKQALGQTYGAPLGTPPSTTGTVIKFSGTASGQETKTIGGQETETDGDTSFWGDAKGILGSALDIFKSGEQAKGASAAQQQIIAAQLAAQQQQHAATPPWLLPVAIGGGVLILVLALRRRG